jgi:putative colanic acid biosynthesis UDP-glucose lipid carrier transferase
MFATAPNDGGAFLWEPRRSASPSVFRWTHGLINRLVSIGDVLVLLATCLVCPWLDHAGAVPVTLTQSLGLFAVEAVVFVFVLRTVAAYRVENYARLQVSLLGIAPGLACAWAVGGAAATAFAPDLTATMAGFLAYHLPQLAALALFRLGARIVVGQIGRRALMRRNTVVIGCGAQAEAVVRLLTAPARAADFNVIGVVADRDNAPRDDAPLGGVAGRPLLGNLTTLIGLGLRDTVDLVVIATDRPGGAALARIVHALRWVSADVLLSLDTTTARSMRGAVVDIGGQPALRLIRKPLKGSQALLKAIEDRVIAGLALFILSPVMLLTALAIRLDSPGAALFRQDRIGLHNSTSMSCRSC